jgi:hypothetical protein
MKKSKVRMEDLPVYAITCEEDGTQGIRMVSLVKDPAIEVKGMYFSSEELEKEKTFHFKTDKDKQIIVGPAMVPNKKILRKDDNDNMYYVYFTPETIKLMVDKFNKENNNKSINVDHTNQMVNAFIQQNWIVEDPTYDKSRFYGFNLPIGTWFIEIKVEDNDFWKNEVKDEGKYGFSIEGLMGQELVEMSNDLNKLIDSLSDDELIEMFRDVMTKKVSFDFDGTITKTQVQQIAQQKIKQGCDVCILTKRQGPDREVEMLAEYIGIKNIIYTNGEPKWSFIIENNIDEHYDDMIDENREISKKTHAKVYKV